MGHARKIEDNKKLARIYRQTLHSCSRGVGYDEHKHRLVRFYASPNVAYFRHHANKALRHKSVESKSKAAFKRIGGMDIWNNS